MMWSETGERRDGGICFLKNCNWRSFLLGLILGLIGPPMDGDDVAFEDGEDGVHSLPLWMETTLHSRTGWTILDDFHSLPASPTAVLVVSRVAHMNGDLRGRGVGRHAFIGRPHFLGTIRQYSAEG